MYVLQLSYLNLAKADRGALFLTYRSSARPLFTPTRPLLPLLPSKAAIRFAARRWIASRYGTVQTYHLPLMTPL